MLKEGDLRVRAVLVSILLIGIALLIAGLVINGPITGNAISEGVVEKGITGMSLFQWLENVFNLEDGEVMLAPEVASIEGNFVHGENIVIDGLNFGVKDPAPPLMYDDFEDGIDPGWGHKYDMNSAIMF
ncbi:MAG: hypothetical protein ABIE22_02670, partial [archaeon]